MPDYPGAVWTPSNPSAGDLLSSGHAAQHATVNNEVAAIETELGVNPSGSDTTVVQRLDAMAGRIWPVNSIYFTTSATNPATTLGFGTWVAWGSGRVPVGVDTGQTEFDTVEETGGEKTHILVVGELAAHTHIQDAHSHTVYGDVLSSSGTARIQTQNTTGPYNRTTSSDVATNQNAGSGTAHNNLQPYITCYMFKRTA